MTLPEFQKHMDRLANQWRNTYAQDRVTRIWNEVQSLPGGWWERAVDEFLDDSRQAPLMSQIRESASRERERLRASQKQKESNEAEKFMSSYAGEDVRMIAGTIRARIDGRKEGSVSDETWKSFIGGLQDVAERARRALPTVDANACGYCGGSGKIMAEAKSNGAAYAFRCTCPAGRGYKAFPEWKSEFMKTFEPDYHSATFVKEGV
jgi:hypothetical protein